MKIVATLFLFLLLNSSTLYSQPDKDYWQQEVYYQMNIDLNAEANQFTGTQNLIYTNNSPDTLNKVFYHLYFNAFQPGSMMDERSRTILDPDRRVRDRISKLNEKEIGYHHILSLKQGGQNVDFTIEQTTMEVQLAKPILPGEQVLFDMEFESQVPLQIRRSGRDNAEGIRFSMTQWYPKMAEYDKDGWHTSTYIAREFYAPYGTFDVKVTIDSAFTLGGTGVLQNPEEIGHGYNVSGVLNRPENQDRLTWHFIAENVHDFGFVADPDMKHYIRKTANNKDVHVIYKAEQNEKNWEKLGAYTATAIDYLSENFGEYQWPQFTVIQGGDGGMEYPMATLITGKRSLGSLVGVTAHELTHMWYYGQLGFNESYYFWMDEGFTEYASNEAAAYVLKQAGDPQMGAYGGYLYSKYRGIEEPLSTHADEFDTNAAYGTAAYNMGNIFLHQLGYIVGNDVMRKALFRFFNEWKFKHPKPEDFIHIVEKESGLVLDWYLNHWIKSTNTIDYALKKIKKQDGKAIITLERKGDFPMPIDVFVEFDDETSIVYTIPLVQMRGEKKIEGSYVYEVAKDWQWTHSTYDLEVSTKGKKIKRVEIDPTLRMADVNRLNNTWPFPNDKQFMQPAKAYWNTYGSSWRPTLWYGENSGIMAGFHSYGNYIFDQYAYVASMRLTSGNLENYDVKRTDVDYTFSLTLPANYSGKSATIHFEAMRYYGVFQNQLIFKKYIGKYGQWSPKRRVFTFSLFHQEKTANRMIDVFDSWDRYAVVGSRITYEMGDPSRNGIGLTTQMASSGKWYSASYGTLTANKTFDWTNSLSSRFGMYVATGSLDLPNQYRITAAGPTLEGAWKNHTWFEFANIRKEFTNYAHFSPMGGNGLLGYGVQGIGSPDVAGNNHTSFVIWNEWRPFKNKWLRPTILEFVSGIGTSWNGNFWSDNPFTNDSERPVLSSMFVGLSYNASDLSLLNRWRPQSEVIRNLQFILRMPFFMNNLTGRGDWNTLLVFGVSNRF